MIAMIQLPIAAVIRAITLEDKWNTEEFDPLPPLIMLFKSKQFWVAIIDITISLVTYFFSKYMDPQIAADTKWLIATMQPVALFVIESWTQENLPVE